eukprot:CAMPEP_0179009088 /NCGR_PEP_ID=MMETSP0795-20121207/16084_1 /TAXON_ID=88552 /ORGANISM="Amoebophrya sp., Strain Ameob2" /LENGTH=219 /DNA_ID=CAMNT_0020704259 /DNA_START=198 /DNA_END=857 /DNA_ORIENTATION=+
MGRAGGMLPEGVCIPGRDSPIPQAPPRTATHFVKGTPLYGPFDKKYETALIGMGCFWCVENLFMKREGVFSTQVGYACGVTRNPTYEEVCSGMTNHSEVCRIVYDPSILTFNDIMKTFWTKHDPTTLNQQGGDRGTQYRSGIYYYNEEQKKIAEESKAKMQKLIDDAYGAGTKQISTEILKAPEDFWMAEDFHQQYDARPGSRDYCGLRPLYKVSGASL